MVFLFILFFCSFYFYTIKNYRPSFILFIPPFIVYFLISGLQYNVGSDYPSYIYIYDNPWVLDRFFKSGEFFFYYSNIILNYLNLPSQSIFILFSFIQSIFIFLYLKKIKKYQIIVWLFFVLFISVTNIYNNQLNGIRQYAALTLFPLLSITLYEKKYIHYIFGCLLAMTFHFTAIIFFSLLVIKPLFKIILRYPFAFFLISLPCYILLSQTVPYIIELTGTKYISYLDGKYFQPRDVTAIITKIYYLPMLLYFFFIFKKRKIDSSLITYMDFCIVIFTITFWSFIMGLDIGLLSRLANYFWFFIIFPLYYVLNNALKKQKNIEFFTLLFYCLFPYIAKVTFLAKGEFLYQSYIFN